MGQVDGDGRSYRIAMVTCTTDFDTGRETLDAIGHWVFDILGFRPDRAGLSIQTTRQRREAPAGPAANLHVGWGDTRYAASRGHGVSYTLPDGRPLLNDVSFRVGDGARVALIGPNGTGKTTLLRIISGELAAEDGSVSASRRWR